MRRHAPALVSLVLAAVVVAAAAWDIARVSDSAHRARDAEVALLRAQVVSHQESTLQWRGLAARSDVDDQIALLSGRAQQLQARLAEAHRAEVAQAADDYQLELEIMFGRAQDGHMRAARIYAHTTVNPAFARLQAAIDRETAVQQAAARDAERAQRDHTVISLVVALAVCGLLLLRWRLSRREHDVAQRSEARLRGLVQGLWDTIAVVGEDGVVQYLSPGVERTLGYEPDELLGRPLAEIVHLDEQRAFADLLAAAGSGGVARTLMRRRDGRWAHVELVVTDMRRAPAVEGLVLTLRDISDRKALEDRLRHQAYHDTLTGLPNRALFEERVGRRLTRAGDDGLAVLFIDLDDFKAINDSLGHEAGDRYLRAVADRLRSCVRDGDIAARLGGDEFAVMADRVRTAADAHAFATRLLAALCTPVEVDGQELFVCGSVGVALAERAGQPLGELLRNADAAMYAAKRRGKRRVELFAPGMHEDAVARVERTTLLARALERDELRVHYQPITALGDGRVVGVEALMRWHSAEHGLVPPGEFIPLAERSGLIGELGSWVLRTACEQVLDWERRTADAGALALHVNVSAVQLEDEGFAEQVAWVLGETGFPAERLTLEITESVVVGRDEPLAALKALGVRLAIDDFGTGYSSLTYLAELPIDSLKLDRSFVSGMTTDPRRLALVRGVLDLAGDLVLPTVAEGIETPEELALLRRMNCVMGQGYLLARPEPPEAVERTLGAVAERS